MPFTQGPVTCDSVTGVALIPNTKCTKMIVRENNQAGTSDLIYTLGGGGAVTVPSGAKNEIDAVPGTSHQPGASLGTVKAASGSIQLVWDEF